METPSEKKQNCEKRFRGAFAAGRDLLERHAQGLILGCTELSLVMNFLSNDLPVIDSIEVLAQACVEVARRVREVAKGET